LADGRLFWIDAQLNYANGHTKDFVCTFVFATDGSLSEHEIELIGVRGEYPGEAVALAIERHVVALGGHAQAAIWVRPFQVTSHELTFGLAPRQLPNGGWRVEFMPGNTLSFYAPWEQGEYDT
jgi:hypothetical protein